MKKNFVTWHFSIFWNTFYIFKIGLCFLGFIGFSHVLNILAFGFCGLHFRNRYIERCKAVLATLLSWALLYHDSFLPGIEQLMAQKANITQFSLSYVLEFIAGFVNINMLIAIPLSLFAIYLASKVLRGCALVFIGFISLWVIDGSSIQQLTSQQDGIIAGERFLKDRTLDEEGMLTQRGSFTRGNLSSYEKQFYENEGKRQIAFSNAQAAAFSFIFITADGLSNAELSSLNTESHAVLQRFDMQFDKFNTVSVSEPELASRLFSSLCGQRHSDSLKNDHALNRQCSLPKALANVGLTSQILFDDVQSSEKVAKIFPDFDIDPRASLTVNAVNSTHSMFDTALDILRQGNAKALFMRFGAGAYMSNKAVAVADFLSNLNVFLDRLDQGGIRSLVVLMPGIGGSGTDITLHGGREIPSDTRCLGSVYFRFSSLPHANEVYHVKPNVSYLALAEIISRAWSVDPYAEGALLSAQALTDELPRTAVVGENDGARFMLFRNRRFCVEDAQSDAWISFEK